MANLLGQSVEGVETVAERITEIKDVDKSARCWNLTNEGDYIKVDVEAAYKYRSRGFTAYLG